MARVRISRPDENRDGRRTRDNTIICRWCDQPVQLAENHAFARCQGTETDEDFYRILLGRRK